MMSPEPFPNRRADAYCFESLASIHMDKEQGHLLWRLEDERPPRCRTPLLYYDRKVGHKHGSCGPLSLTSPLTRFPPNPQLTHK